MAERFPKAHGFDNPNAAGIRPLPFSNIAFHPDRLDQPLRWKRPRRIFIGSMTDLFHEDVTDLMRDQVLGVSLAAPQHTYMVLTKRPERMRQYFIGTKPYPNLWLGVTAENQEMADQRIPILLQTPAAMRFVSVEPCLSEVNLAGWGSEMYLRTIGRDGSAERPGLDWVIAGGESGPGARPMHPNWPRSLRDQCQAAGAPFFFKQWGEWVSVSEVEGPGVHHQFPDGATVRRTGKKLAGCLLDGREWKELPPTLPPSSPSAPR
jgi:protein gp37